MKADAFLSRLDKVQPRGGPASWIARCPAHNDKHPSMTIAEIEGTVLVHCFAGCSIEDILAAVGMEYGALFPDKPSSNRRPFKKPFPAEAVLAVMAFEALVVLISANDMAAGKQLSDDDRKRLSVAAIRLSTAKDLACG
jgi:hypothetical protein